MARRALQVGSTLVFAAVMATMLCAQAQTPTAVQAVPAMPSCPPAPLSLSPCIGYVFGVGSATLSSCCAQLQSFLQSQGPCLCAMSKLAPNPLGLFLGQAQAMIPNVCNLPTNPCDDLSTNSSAPATSTAAVGSTAASPSAAVAAPAATVTGEAAAPAAITPAGAEASAEAPVQADDTPATVTVPAQVVPGSAGSNTSAQVGSKMPALLHSEGPRSSSAAVTILIALFLAYVSAMFV